MKISLVFPPQWVADHPYLSLPSLAGYLRENTDHGVIVKDVNLESYEHFLRPSFVQACYAKAHRELLDLRQRANKTEWEREKEVHMATFLQDGEQILALLPRASDLFEDRSLFYRYDQYKPRLDTLRAALGYVSMAYYPTGLGLTALRIEGSSQSSANILAVALDEKVNPYIEFYRERTVNEILAERPDCVGLSIIGASQLVPALSLAAELKRLRSDLPILVGGPLVTLLADSIANLPHLYDWFDYLVLYEGERPLAALLDHLEGRLPIEEVPNLQYRRDGKVHQTELGRPVSMSALPTPDFRGLPLDRYMAADLMLPLLASRGCYWLKCTFCQHSFGYHNSFRVRDPEQIVADMEKLTERHGTNRFIFNDECMSPSLSRRLSSTILERGIEPLWATDVRAEKAFTPETCELMYRAGCRMVYIGLESGSQNVLDLMQKGTTPEQALDAFRSFASAGIWTHAFLIFGFPGETEADAEETATLILENPDAIHSMAFLDSLVLARHSKLHIAPDDYGVVIEFKPGDDLVVYYDYHEVHGRSEEQKRSFSRRFWNRIETRRSDYHLWYHILRGHFVHYLYEHGTRDLTRIPGLERPADVDLALADANAWLDRVFSRSVLCSPAERALGAPGLASEKSESRLESLQPAS